MTDPDQAAEIYAESIEYFLFFGVIAFIVNWIAWRRGFFKIPSEKAPHLASMTIQIVLSVFAIYLGMALIVAPLLAKLFPLQRETESELLLASTVYQLFILSSIAILLVWYSCRQDPQLIRSIWKAPAKDRPIYKDFAMGAATWVLGFPLVAAIGQLCDLLIYFFTGVEKYEQAAVHFLKMSLSSHLLFILAAVTVILFAPFIEEFLFRGCLQTFLKKHLGRKAAIMLASLCFALFHLAPSQGVGNISLAISLFVFSCFLGFIYEKRASLFASIGLHMTFNVVSTLRILWMPEG